MMRGGLARAALRCYPPATRAARGAEMLDTLREASGDRRGVFVWNVLSLVAAGLGERAKASARVSAGRTIAEAAKLASVLYACLWLTALVVLIERRGWHYDSGVSLYMVGLLTVLLAWSLGRQRLAGMIGFICTVAVAFVVARRPGSLLPVSIVQPIVPAFGYLIMAIVPRRERPSTAAVGALAALVVVSVIVPDARVGGYGQFIVLATASIAGLAVFAVQPRLAIAVAIIWTAIGIELIAFDSTQPAPWKLLVATAPAVLVATAARARVIRRRAI
jgi:hypothetical protein